MTTTDKKTYSIFGAGAAGLTPRGAFSTAIPARRAAQETARARRRAGVV